MLEENFLKLAQKQTLAYMRIQHTIKLAPRVDEETGGVKMRNDYIGK